MKSLTTDVAVIGAGTAGMSAWRAARAHTPNVLLIERAQYGTTCARVGCMPSKLLIAAADAAHTIEHSGVFGVHGGGLRIDGEAVMARVRAERDRFVGFVVEAVEGWPAEHRLLGHARFVGPQALQVQTADGPVPVQAGRVVIATGSRPAMPAAWRAALGDRLIVNDDVFDWRTLPRSVAVVGAGVIGLELAQALHRLGVRVRLYGRGARLGPVTDPVLQKVAADVFGQALPLQLDAQHLEVSREGDEVRVHTIDSAGRVHEERFEFLLAATGRRANVDDIGLEVSGLVRDAAGVPVYDRHTGQAGDSPVFIAGDAGEDRPLLHEAADEGRIAGDNAGRWPDVRVRPRRTPLAVVFSDPQIALAGSSHAELVASGVPFAAGEVSFDDQGRSRVMARNAGALRVYGSPEDGRFLGAEMIGPAAEHIGHLLAWSAQRADTVQQMLDSPFYHPVVEEGLRTALRMLQRALRMGPPPVERCLDCGPGA
ncbi:MAG TPA: dihydrolipoyl dehydrogenase [Rubrivivax sp.]|nr:dihydrolipoyl dehydrogenase [Rubrivivax sp.]